MLVIWEDVLHTPREQFVCFLIIVPIRSLSFHASYRVYHCGIASRYTTKRTVKNLFAVSHNWHPASSPRKSTITGKKNPLPLFMTTANFKSLDSRPSSFYRRRHIVINFRATQVETNLSVEDLEKFSGFEDDSKQISNRSLHSIDQLINNRCDTGENQSEFFVCRSYVATLWYLGLTIKRREWLLS